MGEPEEHVATDGGPGGDETIETRDRDEARIPGAPLARGTTVGRYVILDLLGKGGMGVVYKAADPELDRRVALKLLRARAAEEDRASQRLLREAQALAQLSHPNVVAVHDAGTFGDDVYIAMELIEGQTLRAWLRSAPRSRGQILDVMVAAGEGLAAAHKAGIIHRDFKPDNVIVDDDGRVRVLDFGLARASPGPITGKLREPITEPPNTVDVTSTPSSEHNLLSSELTVAGSVRGTPAYMAPEQHAGGDIDERGDQFSFCVVLYEALRGERPFAGKTVEEIGKNVIAGKLARPIAELDAPAWLRNVIARGLSADREARFLTMRALLTELTRERGKVKRRVIAGAAIVTLMGGAAAIGAVMQADDAAPSPCAGVDAELAGAWDDAAARKLQAAFVATRLPYAVDAAARVGRVLDAYAADWRTARRDTCEATLVRGKQSPALMERRVACLDRRRGKLAALVATLSTSPSEDVVESAIERAHALPSLAACDDAEALLAAVPLPDDPQARVQIATLGRDVDAIEARGQGGEVAPALEALAVPLEEIRALGHAPLLAEALFVKATLEAAGGDPKAAEQTLYAAAQAAAQAKDDVLALRVWTKVINVVGDGQARHEDALALRRVAEPALARAGEHIDPLLHADLLDQIGNVLWAQRKLIEARPYHERALAIRTDALADDDPELATSLLHMGGLAWSEGQNDEARQLLERALAINERAFGPDHPDVSKLLTNLGSVATSQGDLPAAHAYHERALAIAEAAMGKDHTLVAICANNLADVERAQGHLPEARALLERAAAIFTARLGAEHPNVATSLQNLGEVALAEGKADEALAHFARALAGFEAAVGPDHPFVAYPLTAIGSAHVAAGRAADAIAPLERALEIRDAGRAQPTELATTQFALARALIDNPRTKTRAVGLAQAARAAYAAAGPWFARDLAEVDAFLAARR